MTFLLFVVAAAVLLYRVTSSDDRIRYFKIALANYHQLKAAAKKPRPELDAFNAALRLRTPMALVTPALVAVMVFASVMQWSTNTGPRTTNGEWWRLLTAVFAHASWLQLALNAAAFYQVGVIVERLAGRAVLAITFFIAAIVAGLASIAVQPVAPSWGATGAILGVYGLLAAAVILSRRRAKAPAELSPEEVPLEFCITIPPLAVRRNAIIGGVVILINAFAGGVPLAGELAGLAIGLACGLAIMRGVAESTPPAPRVAATAAAGVVLAIILAWPLNGIADVRPEVARVLAAEDHTSTAYQSAFEKLKKGKTSVDEVAQLIDGTITQELKDTDERLRRLKKVPPEHQAMLNDAREFLRLRSESWRLRSESLRAAHKTPTRKRTEDSVSADTAWRVRLEAQFRSTRAAIGKAEAVERSSLEVLARLKAAA